MHDLGLVLALMAAVAALATLARRLGIPYPILLVVGGAALGLLPGLPSVHLEPEIVFLVFLPPLLTYAGAYTSLRDFRANLGPIGLLAGGLVLFTIAAVAVVARLLVEGMSWPVAFVLGAIVSPPDAIAATAIAQRLGLPRRIVTVLEGESLLNDATALVALRMATVAVVTGVFSLSEAVLSFFVMAIGGAVIGLAVAWLIVELRSRIEDPPVEITIALLTPYLAYLPAEQLHFSGVLAAVAAGLYIGRHFSRMMSPATRLYGAPVWRMFIFVLEGLVFILIGLQLNGVLHGLADRPVGTMLLQGLGISLAMIVARIAWVFAISYLPGLGRRAGQPPPSWREVLIVGWAGMRGVVSLAAALALPLTTAAGAPLPDRDLLIFLTYCAIVVTLVGQGLTLPPLIRRLEIGADEAAEQEEHLARVEATEAALARLDQLADEDGVPTRAGWLRTYYEERRHLLAAGHGPDQRGHPGGAEAAESPQAAYRRIRTQVIAAERDAVERLRGEGKIADEVVHRIQRELDHEEQRLA
jgi:CPA1 family monovalent cation:H+ antiporter